MLEAPGSVELLLPVLPVDELWGAFPVLAVLVLVLDSDLLAPEPPVAVSLLEFDFELLPFEPLDVPDPADFVFVPLSECSLAEDGWPEPWECVEVLPVELECSPAPPDPPDEAGT